MSQGNGATTLFLAMCAFSIYGIVSLIGDINKIGINPFKQAEPRIIYLKNREGINYLKQGKEIYIQKNDSTYMLLEDYAIQEQERINKNILRNKRTIEKKLN